MKIVYKKTLKPLYPFEEGSASWIVNYPAKVVIKNDLVYELDDVHYHSYPICNIKQLLEIIPDTK